MTRVIIVNRFFHPDHSATSQLASDLAADLSARGFDVVALTSRQNYDRPSVKLDSIGQYGSVCIRRVWTTSFGRQNILGRSIDYASFYLSAALTLWAVVSRGAVVIAMTDPPMIGVLAVFVTRLRRGTCIQWLQDVFPEVAERLGLLRARPLVSVLKAMRDWSLRRASLVITIGKAMREQVPAQPTPVKMIPNWALEELLDGSNAATSEAKGRSSDLRSEWKLGSDFVVGYSGNMGRAHCLNEVVDAACNLRSILTLQFLFVGGGAQKDSLHARVAMHGLRNVHFKPYQPREVLRASLLVPNIHIVSLDPRLEGCIVPSKFVGVLALGKPVLWIGAPDGEVGRLIRESGCGISVSPGDVTELSTVLRELAEDYSKGGRQVADMAKRASTLWMKEFRRQDALDSWYRAVTGFATFQE